jgi:hypothetical protein
MRADNIAKECYKKSMKQDPVLGRLAYYGIAGKNALEGNSITKNLVKSIVGNERYAGNGMMKGKARNLISRSF